MDLFWLDKILISYFTTLSSYKLFMLNLGGLIGTFLCCGTYKHYKKGGKKK